MCKLISFLGMILLLRLQNFPKNVCVSGGKKGNFANLLNESFLSSIIFELEFYLETMPIFKI